MLKKAMSLATAVLLALVMGVSSAAASEDPWAIIEATRAKVPQYLVNDSGPIDTDSVLRIAVASNSSFAGVLDRLFTQTTLDAEAALLLFGQDLISVGSDLFWNDAGMARIDEWCHDTQSILIVMQEDPVWHDGVPATLDDLVFAYEVISHPDYTGIRWTPEIMNVVGTREFRAGEADYISGLVLSECGRELRMYFVDWHAALQFGGAFWTAMSPRHHLEDIAVGELAAHENVRANTLGYGPFILEAVVPGESKLFSRNDNFHLGPAGVRYISYEIVMPMSLPLMMVAGDFDIGRGFPISQFVNHPDPGHFRFAGRLGPDVSWWYSFRLGSYCLETDRVIVNPDANMACYYLRRAISMIFPLQEIGEILFSGLSIPQINTMNMQHEPFFVPGLNFHTYDPERAMRILDEAGYIDIDGDGLRERPDGSPLTIYLLWQLPGSPAAETNLALHLQSAADVGIDLQLYQGRAHDFQVFVDLANETGEVGWDIVNWGWGGGIDPNPINIWGHTRVNRSMWSSERWDAIFYTIENDPRMWDMDFMTQTYHEWQWAWYEELPAFVGTMSIQLNAVNNRVRNFSSIAPSVLDSDMNAPSHMNWWMIELTAEESYLSE